MYLLVEIMIKKNYCLSCFDIANYVDLGIPNTIYYFQISESLNHIEHIIYPLDDCIYISTFCIISHILTWERKFINDPAIKGHMRS